MINAKIVDNKPICGNCDSSSISGTRDYKGVVMNDKTYTLFQFRCYSCNKDNVYLADVSLEGTVRYEINNKLKTME